MKSSNINLNLQEAYLNQMHMHPVFNRHLKEMQMRLCVKNILDVHAGTSITRDMIDRIEGVSAREFNAVADFIGNDSDNVFDSQRKAATANNKQVAERISHDMVTFILSLPWMLHPEKVIEWVMSNTSTDYVLVSCSMLELNLASGMGMSHGRKQKDGMSALHQHYNTSASLADAKRSAKDQIRDIFLSFSKRLDRCQKELAVQGYYPLIQLSDNIQFVLGGKKKYPTHILRTVLYSKDKPDRLAYDSAKYIFQVNTICNLKCPFCYVEKTNEQMDEAIYLKYLQNVKVGELIALRGGEPFFSPNFMDGFLEPAINRGIRVLVESNGQFMGTPNYEVCLNMLAHENVEVRLSLDRDHLNYLEADIRRIRLKRLAAFIKDAEARNINYSFTALGSDQKQVKAFLKEIDFKSYVDHSKIKPLTKYSHIEDLPIKNSYIDVKGNEHDHIVDYTDRGYSVDFLSHRLGWG